MKKLIAICLVTSVAQLGACSNTADDAGQPVAEKGAELNAGKADEWGPNDRPSLFSDDLEYRLDALPLEGTPVNIPWAGAYWPVYQDSLNYRWDGDDSMSPAEKFGKAFGYENFEDEVSRHHGIDDQTSRIECESNSDCNKEDDGQAGKGKCAKRRGQDKGRCIPTWWGICHAWAPVAIVEPEPVNPVTRNGVEFKVQDIKALITLAYNRSTSKFLSLRCNEEGKDIELDEYGNPTGEHIECKDTNPGTFHVVAANYIGLKGESFVEDRTYDDEVWNQPVAGYRVTKLDQVSPRDANELAGANPVPVGDVEPVVETQEESVETGAWFDREAFEVPAEARVTVTMTQSSGAADLYVRFGEAPSGDDYDCRPFSNEDTETCELVAADEARTLYIRVRGEEAAEFELRVETSSSEMAIPEEYIFNSNAATLYHVKTELDYITESPSGTDGNLADRIATYTKTDRYEYILEVDAEGKIMGGEWVGSSKKNHPDFLWLPTGRSHHVAVGGKLSYALVKDLLDASIGGDDGNAEMVRSSESITVAGGEWQYFGPFNVESGDLEVVMSGEGDADLFVAKDNNPSDNGYICRPYMNGSLETCNVTGPGTFYVGVKGYAESSSVVLNIAYKEAAVEDSVDQPETPEVDVEHLEVTDSVEKDGAKYYTIDVAADKGIVITTEASTDIDLYVKMHQAPTTSAYDKRGYTPVGDERIVYTPNSSGTLHIMVHGYKAAEYELITTDL